MNKGQNNENNAQLLQIQQKNIHYKSEIAKQLDIIHELEKEMEKEKLRNKYLQNKLIEAQNTNFKTYQKEIFDLKNKLLSLEVVLEEEKNLTNDLQGKLLLAEKRNKEKKVVFEAPKETNLQAIFQYATLLPNEEEKMNQITIFGDFTIVNTGTEPISSIVICIKINPKESGKLSGKIGTLKPTQNSSGGIRFEEWEYALENWKEKILSDGEYWIKSNLPTPLRPSGILTFSNFEVILVKPENRNGVVIEGFVYCKELNHGIQTLNNIVVNFL